MSAKFFYDFAAPESYLVAESINALLGPAEWLPVHGFSATQMSPLEVERRAEELQLQPVRWPANALSSHLASLTAVYTAQIGRVVAYSFALFRQIFAGGRDLDQATLLIAGAACELHPNALLKGAQLASVAKDLEANCQAAVTAGIEQVPAISVDGEIFYGVDGLEVVASRKARCFQS